ncbi:hypothetical protein BHM03_00004696 [Ensete ventricosum]|nr:hypothetical protein BHM03_00004696 [Ensete ventricosum]
MSILSKLRCITVDVTGTLIAYKGELGDYYCMAAKAVGLPCPDYKRMHEGFKAAYTDMVKEYPCFGHAAKMPNIDWWRVCVKDSFIRVNKSPGFDGRPRFPTIFIMKSNTLLSYDDILQAGYEYDAETFEKVFRRIYSSFGSSAPYGSEWDFGVFSGIEGVEKPDPRIYEIALEKAGNIAAEEAVHIGDSMRKDYLPATSMGMQAMILDRFKTSEAEDWRKSVQTRPQAIGAAHEERGSELDEREVGYSPRVEEAQSGALIEKRSHNERLIMAKTGLDVLEASLEELY